MVAAVAAVGVVFGPRLVAGTNTPAAGASIVPPTPPTAEDVAAQLSGVINAYATTTGAGGRIGRVSCVSGGGGSYACSYVRTIRDGGGLCALAVLQWTPNAASTYTVKTAGRVALPPERCGPVTKVLHVLGTSG